MRSPEFWAASSSSSEWAQSQIPTSAHWPQRAEAERPVLPFRAFTEGLVVWNGTKSPKGAGWITGGEPGTSVSVEDPDADGKRAIHFRTAVPGYRRAAFGWDWAFSMRQTRAMAQSSSMLNRHRVQPSRSASTAMPIPILFRYLKPSAPGLPVVGSSSVAPARNHFAPLDMALFRIPNASIKPIGLSVLKLLTYPSKASLATAP
jgi:hypothetical protein